MQKIFQYFSGRRATATPLALLAVALVAVHPLEAKKTDCPVGVNVNSFQNFSADEQDAIVRQLKTNKVRFVRTSLRPDQKNMNLAKKLQDEGIGLVLVPGLKCKDGTRERPANAQYHTRAAMPLSAVDPAQSRANFQDIFDKLDAAGVVLTAIELGNELNWADFNGDFPVPGQGKAFNLSDLSHDPEAKRVAQGLLQYLKTLKTLKEVRDNSQLNKNTPLITAGMAACSGGIWQAKSKIDGVSIPATYSFLRARGLDDLVDGYGVHVYPGVVKEGDKTALNERNQKLDESIFPPGKDKPFWLTEWGFPSTAQNAADDKTRARSVVEMREYFRHLHKQGRLGGIFWYVWNEPDRCSIYRNDSLMEAGRHAVAPL
ncbi:MAG: hypothetical protein KGS72_07770 [Cyanobacteria bacterium REEB67]|nr:hypothetical protein [Cyanobacteria bacterium REEB67]